MFLSTIFFGFQTVNMQSKPEADISCGSVVVSDGGLHERLFLQKVVVEV